MADAKSSNKSINLYDEENRLRTFDNKWPHAFISPHILAKIGLSYIGPHDQVKCVFCQIKISTWELGDNEVTEHFRWSPNCSLLNKKDTFNKPKQPTSELNELLSQIDIENAEVDFGAYVETPLCNMKENLKNYCFPHLLAEADRLDTYNDWPKFTNLTPRKLSKAGFFHTQKADSVICFSCGGGLREWNGEDPWEQHALYFGECIYLNSIKGSDYVESVKKSLLK